MVTGTGQDIANHPEMAAATNRTVSFVSHLELDVESGKVLPGAMTFGDVNKDNGNELIVGTTGGLLLVFKGHNCEPWCKLSGLGEITSVVVGDITGSGTHHVLAINTEGNSYLYDFSDGQESEPEAAQLQLSADPTEINTSYRARLLHMQLLLTNVKMMILGDVDGDGINELILCHTDRVVTACRWNKSSESFDILQEWKLRHFVGGVTLHGCSENGRRQIIATQPGCSYAVLHSLWDSSNLNLKGSDNTQSDVTYNPMSSLSRSQNPSIPCQIVGDICKGPNCEKGYFALCTLDGTIKLMEDDQVLWSFQVGHQLFAMDKLDVLANGKEEVIVCAWNGLTYIVDHDRNVVKYQFHDSVQAFSAGQYAVEEHENVVSLVYANFRNKLCLYYNIQLPQLQTTNFLVEAEKNKQIQQLFAELGAETEEQKVSMIRFCMYGLHVEPEEVMSSEKKELLRKKSDDT